MQILKRVAYAALLGFAIALPFILQGTYQAHLATMFCIFAVLALSLNIIIGYMGQVSLGHAAFFGLGAYTSALLCTRLGVPVWIGWMAAVTCSGVVGFLIGYVSLARTKGVALAIVTFGFGLILSLVASNWYALTRGYSGITGIPAPVVAIPWLPSITFQTPSSYYYLTLALLLFTAYLTYSLLRSKFGRALVATRENAALASTTGIDVFREYVVAFTVAAALAGLAGAAYAHFVRFVGPKLLGMNYMFAMLIMVLLGGKGTIAGPILGAAFYVFVSEWLRITEQIRLVVFGVIVVAVIVFMPEGIYPRLASLWKRFVAPRFYGYIKPDKQP